MDFRLRHLVSQRERGIPGKFANSPVITEISVIAKVSNLAKWKSLTEIKHKTELRNFDVNKNKNDGWIVTGRLAASQIEEVRKLSFVKSLKAAKKILPTLHQTIPNIRAGSSLPRESLGDEGKNCIVGIVDYGGDFAHENFTKADGTTRLISIWDQRGGFSSSSPQPYGYGSEYLPAQINAALKTKLPYDSLGYGPNPDVIGRPQGSHGTHVMDIAAGNGRGTGYPGVATESDIIFVETSTAGLFGKDSLGQNFGDSVSLVEAVDYIFRKAGDRPCVVNLSLGTNGGPHDGTTLVERALDVMVRSQPNRAIVIAAANSYNDHIHSRGVVPEGSFVDIEFYTPPFPPTSGIDNYNWNEFEMWYESGDSIDIEFFDPSGNSLIRLSEGEEASTENGDLFLSHRSNDPNNGDNYVGIILNDTLVSGNWKVRLHGNSIRSGGEFHAWLERDNYIQANFLPEYQDDDFTLGSISCGLETITVGSYSSTHLGAPISFFSSAGPTRDGRQKPTISAPGSGIWAAHSRTFKYIVEKSGTSMAAPAVTGVIALLLSEAEERNISLSSSDIRDILISSSENVPSGEQWDNRYGFGMLRADDAINSVITRATNAT